MGWKSIPSNWFEGKLFPCFLPFPPEFAFHHSTVNTTIMGYLA
jgi:hypothetical protein